MLVRRVFALTALPWVAACQLLLAEVTDRPEANATTDASNASGDVAFFPEAGRPCALDAVAVDLALEGTPRLLITDDEGAYFVEELSSGATKLSSWTASAGGPLVRRSIETLSGEAIRLVWPDPEERTIWYVASGPSDVVFRKVGKALSTLDNPPFVNRAAPAAERYGPGVAKLAVVAFPGPGPGVEVGFAVPRADYGLDVLFKDSALGASSALGLITDGVSVYMAASSRRILKFGRGNVATLFEATDGARRRSAHRGAWGDVYWLNETDIRAVSANGGASRSVAPRAELFTVDDVCLYFGNSAAPALSAVPLDGGAAVVLGGPVRSMSSRLAREASSDDDEGPAEHSRHSSRFKVEVRRVLSCALRKSGG
ncbi:MAG: hypothetical protein IPG50_04195 [Myxococcales bacterium]|nr:hypothetical protein [Myxococcales bacterium]